MLSVVYLSRIRVAALLPTALDDLGFLQWYDAFWDSIGPSSQKHNESRQLWAGFLCSMLKEEEVHSRLSNFCFIPLAC